MKTRTLLAIAAVAASLAATPAPAQEQQAVEFRYAAVAPQKSVWGMQLERWSGYVHEESGGTVKFNLFLGGQLGSEADIVQQVARGRIDAAGVGAVFASLLAPELQLLLLPMYFSSPAEMDCVLDTALLDTVGERLAAKGVHVIGWGEAGTMHLIGRKPYTSPGDIAGAKAGTYGSRMGVLLWQALGATPTATTTTEVASALQTGLVDVTVTLPALYVPAGINKVAPVMTQVDMFHSPTLALMNKAAWDRLSPQQQAAMRRARQRAPAPLLRQEVRAFQDRMLEAHAKGGGQLVQASAEQQAAFRHVVSAAWPRMVQEAGPEGPRFFALMEAGRKACEGRN